MTAVRRYGEPVDVRYPRPGEVPGVDVEEGGPGSGPPAEFLWRGRVYTIRAVLGHWRERYPWWSSMPARAVLGDLEPPSYGGDGGTATAALPRPLLVEQEVWRVEASRGRAYDTGVYDLCHDVSPGGDGDGDGPGSGEAWLLTRVGD